MNPANAATTNSGAHYTAQTNSATVFQIDGVGNTTVAGTVTVSSGITSFGPISVSGSIAASGTITSTNLSGDSGWANVSSLSNGFTTGSLTPAYRLLNNVVYLRGNAIGGTAGTTAFTLPVGYRPAQTMVFAIQQYGSAGDNYVTVNPDGTVVPAGTAAWFSGIVFPTN